MSVVALIQARISSTRLPGKVLLDLGGEPVLAWVHRAATAASGVDDVVVATSVDPSDDPIEAWCTESAAECVRGSLDDVLGRFVAALGPRHDVVVRLTADCPFLDPELIAGAVAAFQAMNVRYLSTVHPRSLPRGLDVEVTDADALRAAAEAAVGTDRVHVTPYLWQRPEQFPQANLAIAPALDHLRLTLDTEQDLELLRMVAARLPVRPPRLRHIRQVFAADPSLIAINGDVAQKQLAEG